MNIAEFSKLVSENIYFQILVGILTLCLIGLVISLINYFKIRKKVGATNELIESNKALQSDLDHANKEWKALQKEHEITVEELREIRIENEDVYKLKEISDKARLEMEQRLKASQDQREKAELTRDYERRKRLFSGSNVIYVQPNAHLAVSADPRSTEKVSIILSRNIETLKAAIGKIPKTSSNHKRWISNIQYIIDHLTACKSKVLEASTTVISNGAMTELLHGDLGLALDQLSALRAYGTSCFKGKDGEEVYVPSEIKERFGIPLDSITEAYDSLASILIEDYGCRIPDVRIGDRYDEGIHQVSEYHQLGELGMGWISAKLKGKGKRIFDVVSFGMEPGPLLEKGKKVIVVHN